MTTKKTKDDLIHELRVIKADSLQALSNAYKNIDKASKDRYMASGITITIKNINRKNETICDEFLIQDGLSAETIEAIKKDIKATYELRLLFNKI